MAENETLPGGVIRWEDPPSPAGRGAQRPWAVAAAQLRLRPGCWALIDESTTYPAYAARINAGAGWWQPRGAFEACVRVVDGQLRLYARFVGDAGAAQAAGVTRSYAGGEHP